MKKSSSDFTAYIPCCTQGQWSHAITVVKPIHLTFRTATAANTVRTGEALTRCVPSNSSTGVRKSVPSMLDAVVSHSHRPGQGLDRTSSCTWPGRHKFTIGVGQASSSKAAVSVTVKLTPEKY